MPTTLFYDAECGFCRWSAAKVAAWDRRRALRLVALQDRAESDRLLRGMGEEERMSSWHLVSADGTVHSGGDAFAPLLRLLPGGPPLARAAAALRPLTSAGYRLVADRRGLFGRLLSAGAKRRADERLTRRRLT